MENEMTIPQLIGLLTSSDLIPDSTETRLDRQSGALRIRAKFANGECVDMDITGKKDIADIYDLFQENLKRVFARDCEYRDLLKLEIGKRYTILVESEFGLGVHAIQFTLEKIRVGRFAQYAHCIDLIIRIKRKRDPRVIQFYGKKSFAIFQNWIDINTDPLGPVDNSGPLSCRQSKYLSFDDRYMTDAVASAGETPLYQSVVPCRREKGGVR